MRLSCLRNKGKADVPRAYEERKCVEQDVVGDKEFFVI